MAKQAGGLWLSPAPSPGPYIVPVGKLAPWWLPSNTLGLGLGLGWMG